MAKMADNLYDADVYCPFYKGTEHKQVIRCEGPVSGTALRLGFAGKNKRAEYQAKYCNTAECAHCLIYRCMILKYEEEGTC
jgi:hypothetical protein